MQRLVYRCAVLLLLGMGGVGIAAAQSPEPALAQSQPSDRHNQILKLISRKEYEQA